jgi:hypothetical protein
MCCVTCKAEQNHKPHKHYLYRLCSHADQQQPPSVWNDKVDQVACCSRNMQNCETTLRVPKPLTLPALCRVLPSNSGAAVTCDTVWLARSSTAHSLQQHAHMSLLLAHCRLSTSRPLYNP